MIVARLVRYNPDEVARPVEVPRQTVADLLTECNRLYPPVKTGMSILTFGAAGVTQAKRREECFAAARSGQEDPRTSLVVNPVLLWRSKDPWIDRRTDSVGQARYFANLTGIAPGGKTGGSVLAAIAKGFRPYPVEKFRDLERKATIIGGITALSMLDIAPFNRIDPSSLPPLKLNGDISANALALNCQLLGSFFKVPRQELGSMQACAEFIRAKVIENKAETLAWYCRALTLCLAGSVAVESRQKVEASASAVLEKSADYIMKIPAPPFAQIIGVAVKITAYKLAGDQARTTIEDTAIDIDIAKYKQEITQALQLYQADALISSVNDQINQAKALRDELAAQSTANGELIGNVIVGGICAVGTVGTVLTVRAIYRAVQRRKKSKNRRS